ncbi:hypothetical protein [Enterococcus sp.]|uniref:hypothetical protein n=1 Tax=Enterococcus sp. TaxID=35783 RepID=UPI00289FB509|nr:hypothetical protein [Enterococcus sp.]
MRNKNIKEPFKEFTEYESQRTQEKGIVKVGESYICTPEKPFTGKIRAQVSRIYKNSALVKIISCLNEDDDVTQKNMNDVCIVQLKKFHEVC